MARPGPVFAPGHDAPSPVGGLFVLHAMVRYRVIGLARPRLPQTPMFGVAPGPLTIFTLGML